IACPSMGLGVRILGSFKRNCQQRNGPNLSGSYDVRQFGLVPIGGVIVPVAVTAQASDGSYESGQQLLTRMATKLASFNGNVPSAECV
ncbi:hypothetical protein ACQX17_00005, partial [Corynebacterium diphtheriae]